MDRNVNRAARAAAEAVSDDREYRGVGREATKARKAAVRRAERRLRKAVLAAERAEAP